MDDRPLDGRVALVTGAARGQGRSHAMRLAAAGADVVVSDLVGHVEGVPYPMGAREDLEETRRLVEQSGQRCVAVEADVRDSAQVDGAVRAAVETFGSLDVAVANAGITIIESAVETTDEQWGQTLAVNLTGVFHTVRAAAAAMRGNEHGGSIVCTGSVCSQRAQAGLAAYGASKHGVLGLVRQFALELAPERIRVNIVEPGNTDTPMINNAAMYARLRPDLDEPGRDEAAAAFARMNVMPVPWVAPEDVSEAVVWLASDASRYVTGIELPVDAGLLLTPGLRP